MRVEISNRFPKSGDFECSPSFNVGPDAPDELHSGPSLPTEVAICRAMSSLSALTTLY